METERKRQEESKEKEIVIQNDAIPNCMSTMKNVEEGVDHQNEVSIQEHLIKVEKKEVKGKPEGSNRPVEVEREGTVTQKD